MLWSSISPDSWCEEYLSVCSNRDKIPMFHFNTKHFCFHSKTWMRSVVATLALIDTEKKVHTICSDCKRFFLVSILFINFNIHVTMWWPLILFPLAFVRVTGYFASSNALTRLSLFHWSSRIHGNAHSSARWLSVLIGVNYVIKYFIG